jgi:putative membrane protein
VVLSVVLSAAAGILLGIIAGILPGLHPNAIAALIAFDSFSLETSVMLFCCLVVSNIFEFLSACYLSVPEEGEALAALPMQRMLLDKRSLAAMKIAAYTSVITYAVFMGTWMFLSTVVSVIYESVRSYAWVFLLGICAHLIIKEKKTFAALIIFIVAGVVGAVTFELGMNDPFLPMLSGLFGISALLLSSTAETKIPKQMSKVVIDSGFWELAKASVIGIVSSIVMTIVPSMSSSQIGLISEEFGAGRKSDGMKIASMTSINIADNVLSLIALAAIGKGRSGVVERIGEIIEMTNENFCTLLFCGFAACVIGSWLLIKSSIFASKHVSLLNSKWLNFCVIAFVTLLVVLSDGILGLIILAASTLLGILCIRTGVRRSQMLGCLVIPTIIFYLRIV